jgi:hypothetical protein
MGKLKVFRGEYRGEWNFTQSRKEYAKAPRNFIDLLFVVDEFL